MTVRNHQEDRAQDHGRRNTSANPGLTAAAATRDRDPVAIVVVTIRDLALEATTENVLPSMMMTMMEDLVGVLASAADHLCHIDAGILEIVRIQRRADAWECLD